TEVTDKTPQTGDGEVEITDKSVKVKGADGSAVEVNDKGVNVGGVKVDKTGVTVPGGGVKIRIPGQ
ncbi:MAG: hypothetical protein KC731_21275, partial [Myxococcales bacterium]|nr:hypothetical protein [Myxococcales bacterium]